MDRVGDVRPDVSMPSRRGNDISYPYLLIKSSFISSQPHPMTDEEIDAKAEELAENAAEAIVEAVLPETAADAVVADAVADEVITEEEAEEGVE